MLFFFPKTTVSSCLRKLLSFFVNMKQNSDTTSKPTTWYCAAETALTFQSTTMRPLGVLQCLALRRLFVAAGGNSGSDSFQLGIWGICRVVVPEQLLWRVRVRFPAEHHLSVVLMLDWSVFLKGLLQWPVGFELRPADRKWDNEQVVGLSPWDEHETTYYSTRSTFSVITCLRGVDEFNM